MTCTPRFWNSVNGPMFFTLKPIKISKGDICAYAYVRGRMRMCVGCLYNWLPVRGLLQNPIIS